MLETIFLIVNVPAVAAFILKMLVMELKFKINQTLKIFKIKTLFMSEYVLLIIKLLEKLVQMTFRALAEINLIKSLTLPELLFKFI